MVSLMSLSLRSAWCSRTQGKSSPPRPSGPCSSTALRSYSIGNAAPIRGQRGGSSCSTTTWTFRVALSEETLPAVAARASTSRPGSLSARAMAKAASIPGSATRITLSAIGKVPFRYTSVAGPARDPYQGFERGRRPAVVDGAGGAVNAVGQAADRPGGEQGRGRVGQDHAAGRAVVARQNAADDR